MRQLRSQHTLALLVLGVAVGAIVIPWVAEGRDKDDSRYVDVTIILNENRIQIDPQTIKLQPEVGPDSIRIKVISDIAWDACFIDFPGGSPFDTIGTTADGDLVLTGNRGRAAVGRHKFTIVFKDRFGDTVGWLDPDVINDPPPHPSWP